jgi:hypothetical protein
MEDLRGGRKWLRMVSSHVDGVEFWVLVPESSLFKKCLDDIDFEAIILTVISDEASPV